MSDPDAPENALETNEAESPESVTRRLWLRTIGQTAASLGFIDQLPPVHAQVQPLGGALPAGLYEPSRDHLAHAMMQQSRFHVIPPDSPTDYVRPLEGPFTPQFFSPSEFAVIHRITALFLGEPPSPASPVVDEVAQWIDLRIFSAQGIRAAAARLDPSHVALIRAYVAGGRGEDDPAQTTTRPAPDPQQICRSGIRWIAEQSNIRHQTEFLSLPPSQQLDLLTTSSREAGDFFLLIKAEVVRGFYTSQTGLQEISYKGNGFYARSPGCR